MVKFKVGECYRVKFWDHCQFDDFSEARPFECEIFGRVTTNAKDHIIVHVWITYEKDGSIADSNSDGYVILKKVIEEVEYFGRADL